MKLQLNAPINNLSIGNVSYNFARELIKKDKLQNIFPQKDNFDLSAFDQLNDVEKIKLVQLTQNRLKTFDENLPTLKVWHINGSEESLGSKRFLYTFYEVDEPTQEELNLVANHKAVFFSSSEATEIFKKRGLDNVYHVPLGFDPDFKILENNNSLDKDVVHFGLIGKLEKRKNTQRIIKLWLDKFGNDKKYQLTCLVNNPFFDQNIYKEIIKQTLGSKVYNNINFLEHLETNSEVNQLLNAIDVDLSGISNGEGFNLPSFNSTALGKWSVVTNCSAHKDWATKENSILLEVESEKQPCYDNMFFKQNSQFNQGSYYKVSDDVIVWGMEAALEKAQNQSLNKEGLKLQNEFTYCKSVDKLLQLIKERD